MVALAASATLSVGAEQRFGPFSVYDDEPELMYLEDNIGLGAADDFLRAAPRRPPQHWC
jgi:hypothetical protein